MSENELKPCPFCGGKAITATFLDWDDLEYMALEVNDSESIDGEVTCENEHCINGWWLTPEQWQTRPIEDALNARIAELEAECRWIPVSERLPDNWKPVLTIDMSESTRVPVPAFYDPETSRWSTHFPYDLWVTHWMPLPTPPIMYGKESEE